MLEKLRKSPVLSPTPPHYVFFQRAEEQVVIRVRHIADDDVELTHDTIIIHAIRRLATFFQKNLKISGFRRIGCVY